MASAKLKSLTVSVRTKLMPFETPKRAAVRPATAERLCSFCASKGKDLGMVMHKGNPKLAIAEMRPKSFRDLSARLQFPAKGSSRICFLFIEAFKQ